MLCQSFQHCFFVLLSAHSFLKVAGIRLQEAASKGLKANEWVSEVAPILNGKGGGKELSAQATGTNTHMCDDAMVIALDFSKMALNL